MVKIYLYENDVDGKRTNELRSLEIGDIGFVVLAPPFSPVRIFHVPNGIILHGVFFEFSEFMPHDGNKSVNSYLLRPQVVVTLANEIANNKEEWGTFEELYDTVEEKIRLGKPITAADLYLEEEVAPLPWVTQQTEVLVRWGG